MSATEGVETAGALPDRLDRRVQSLRARVRRISLDRWLLIIGGVLAPLGLLLILIAWIGAARTPLLQEQLDYLISGGLIGLALVVAGGFVYFAYWLTLLVRDGRAGREQLERRMDRVETLLETIAVGVSGGVSAGTTPRGRAATRPAALVATAKGTMVHRPDCAVVAGKTGLRRVAADASGFTPCSICQPLAERPIEAAG